MKKFFSHPLILSLLVLSGLIFLNSQGWLRIAQDALSQLTASGQKITYQFSLKINNFINLLTSVNKLNQENIKLEQENRELLGQIVNLKEIGQENEFLRQQIGLSNSEPRELILANIIGQDSSNLGKYFLIDKGEKDGVKKNDVVIIAGDLLVGQIIEIADSFSRVRLIIDSNSRVNALIQETGVTGLVRGDQGVSLMIDLLPQKKAVVEGETVVTSGLAGVFPDGLLIGQIQRVISSDVQISQEAKIKPAVDFTALKKVFVIRK